MEEFDKEIINIPHLFETKGTLEDMRTLYYFSTRVINHLLSSYEYKKFLGHINAKSIVGFPIPLSKRALVLSKREADSGKYISSLYISNLMLQEIYKNELSYIRIDTNAENDALYMCMRDYDGSDKMNDTLRNIIKPNLYGQIDLMDELVEEHLKYIEYHSFGSLNQLEIYKMLRDDLQ